MNVQKDLKIYNTYKFRLREMKKRWCVYGN